PAPIVPVLQRSNGLHVHRQILQSVAAGPEIRLKSFRSIARVAELADALDLGSSPARGGSSSLTSRISAGRKCANSQVGQRVRMRPDDWANRCRVASPVRFACVGELRTNLQTLRRMDILKGTLPAS